MNVLLHNSPLAIPCQLSIFLAEILSFLCSLYVNKLLHSIKSVAVLQRKKSKLLLLPSSMKQEEFQQDKYSERK